MASAEQVIEEAERFNDLGRLEHLRTERDRLMEEPPSAHGIHGKSLRLGAESDKFRVRVNNAIQRACDTLSEGGLTQAADHLRVSITVGDDQPETPSRAPVFRVGRR